MLKTALLNSSLLPDFQFNIGLFESLLLGAKYRHLTFSAIFQPRFEANELVSHAMPPLFWYNKAAEYKVPPSCLPRFGGCSTFVDEAKVHDIKRHRIEGGREDA